MNFFDMLVIDNEKPNKSQSLSQNPNELMWDHQTSTSANDAMYLHDALEQ